MKQNTLSHRERALLALEHKETDRVPFGMACSGINSPSRENFEAFLARERGLTLDSFLNPLLDLEILDPPLKQARPPGDFDIWGVHRSPVANTSGGSYDEIDYFPLAKAETADDLKKHTWPSPDWFDYAALPAIVGKMRQTNNRCLYVHCGNIFETSWYMRGFERMFMDCIDEPEFAHALMDTVCDFYIEHATRILSAVPGEIDLIFTADDIAGQKGLLMSLDMWEEFIKPRHVKLNRRIHELGARVMYHSDGAVTKAVPGLIDMGIDVLQALQFDADGMDPVELKEKYGDRLCFEGGVSVQKTLPFGSPEDVRAEVAKLSRVLGKGGGYILGPSHVIQAGTSPENIAALFDEAARPWASR
jgi:uroporphyrinogen decarboxylase